MYRKLTKSRKKILFGMNIYMNYMVLMNILIDSNVGGDTFSLLDSKQCIIFLTKKS